MRKQSNKLILVGILVILANFFLPGCGSKTTSSNNQVNPTASPTSNSVSSNQTAVLAVNGSGSASIWQDGDWVYFVWRHTNPMKELCRMKIAGGEVQWLDIYPDDGTDIKIAGDWVYYVDGGLSRCKIEVSDLEKKPQMLVDGDGAIFDISGDWVYYRSFVPDNAADYGDLYRIKTDGSGRQKLNDDGATFLNVVGDWIYYSNWSDGAKLYRTKTNGSERQKLNDDRSYLIKVYGDWVYYQGGGEFFGDYGNLYRIKTDGSGRQKVNDDYVIYLDAVGDWVYYRGGPGSETGESVYRVKTDGSGRQRVINQLNILNPDIAGDWLYFSKDSFDPKLYRVKTDGSGQEQLVQ